MFKLSDAYWDFLERHGSNKTIGIRCFRDSLCKCICDPSEDSCMDLLLHGLQEYMTVIKNAPDLKPDIGEQFAWCTCKMHNSDGCDDGTDCNPFNNLLKQGVYEMLRATCCPPEQHPKLISDLESKPPKLIPWKCTHGTCQDCVAAQAVAPENVVTSAAT